MRILITFSCLLFIAAMIACASTAGDMKEQLETNDQGDAREELHNRFFLDYRNEKHFIEVVKKADFRAFLLFLRVYDGMPCTYSPLLWGLLGGALGTGKGQDDWCYSNDAFETDAASMDWFVEQLAKPDYPREQRKVILRAMAQYDINRRLAIKLLSHIGPDSTNCNIEDIQNIIIMEEKSRSSGFLGQKTKPCWYYKEQATPLKFYRQNQCPKNIAVIKAACPALLN